MTLERFRRLVYDMAKYYGQPYLKLTDVEQLNELLQIQLDDYCRRTGCLTSDRAAFTPVAGEDSASLVNTEDTTVIYFASRMASIENVFIEAAPLAAMDSSFKGPSSASLAAEELTGYQTASNARPSFWWMDNPQTLRFNCPFDQAYSNCYVSGKLLHSALDTYLDHADLELANEDIFPAARLCGGTLLSVTNPEQGMKLLSAADDFIDERAAELDNQRDGSTRRQSTRSTTLSLRGRG